MQPSPPRSWLTSVFWGCQYLLNYAMTFSAPTTYQLSIFPLGSFYKKNKLFPSPTSTMRSWPRHVSPDPALEKAAGEHERAGHLGGLLWIKSYFQRVPTCATGPGKRPWNYGRTHYSEPLSTRPHAAVGGDGPPCRRGSADVSQNERKSPCWDRTRGTGKDGPVSGHGWVM